MPFLVVVKVVSNKSPGGKAERIETTASYSLYDVDKKLLINSEERKASNSGKEKEVPRAQLWYALGEEIATRIEQFYADYKKKTKVGTSTPSAK
jgi:hypothetical protein